MPKKDEENERTEEESGLEEELEKEEDYDSDFSEFRWNHLNEFLESDKISAPVLEKIATASEIPDLEQNFDLTPPKTEGENINYDLSSNYSSSGNYQVQTSVLTEFRPPVLEPRDSEFVSQELLEPVDNVKIRGDFRTEKINADFIRQKKELPFEEKEKKYKSVKVR